MKIGTCWEMLGHTLGSFSDGFGMVSGKSSGDVKKHKILKFVREYFSSIGLLVTITFSRSPDKKKKHIINLKFDFSIVLYICFLYNIYIYIYIYIIWGRRHGQSPINYTCCEFVATWAHGFYVVLFWWGMDGVRRRRRRWKNFT